MSRSTCVTCAIRTRARELIRRHVESLQRAHLRELRTQCAGQGILLYAERCQLGKIRKNFWNGATQFVIVAEQELQRRHLPNDQWQCACQAVIVELQRRQRADNGRAELRRERAASVENEWGSNTEQSAW